MISYTYTASGAKIRQQLESGDKGGISTRRDYAGAFVFVNNAPGWFSTPHGRFVYVNDGWQNEFHLRASTSLSTGLGNTRVVLVEEIGDKLKTLQQKTDYYPFGMVMNQTNPGTGPENKLLYNGKEIQGDVLAARKLDWYDYGARFYDPQIARWHSVDPLAEKMRRWSPYVYAFNNPIRYIDADGMIPWDQVVPGGRFTSGFGPRGTGQHNGIDIAAAEGTPINAFASGKVVETGYSSSWGNFVVVEHSDNFFSLYAHIRHMVTHQRIETIILPRVILKTKEEALQIQQDLHLFNN